MAKKKLTIQPVTQQSPQLVRNKEFVSRYASNVHFDQSIWGMRLTFGELLGGATNNQLIDQHTAISMSWEHAKIFQAYLELHVAAHESANGKIEIPSRIYPPFLEANAETQKDPVAQEKFKELQSRVEDIRKRLGGEQKS